MRKILTTFVMVMCTLMSIAQSRIITGKVTDATGKPVEGASIILKGTTTGTSADAGGNFKISAKTKDVLVVSAINFSPQEFSVGNQNNLNITLVGAGEAQIQEVVVTAVGITRQSRSLGYATSLVKGEELTKARESNVINSLAGKAAGVRVNAQSGTLGGSAKIVIRGATSLGDDNQPIFVVDGFPITNSSSVGGTTKNNVDYGNRVGDLNSDDIESINILKGAAATALYGYRAKNGAVIITTKRGKKGKTSITVNSSVRFDNVLILPEFQNEYAQGNYGVYDLKYTNGWGPKISAVQNTKFKDFKGDSVILQAYPDNVKNFFQTGISTINNVSIAGGGDNSDYRLSVSAVNQTGVIPKSRLDRYTISFNAGREFTKAISNRFNFSYSAVKGEGRPSQSSNNSNIITSSIYGLPRVVDIDKLRNNYQDPITGVQTFLSTDKTGNNPFWIINYNTNNNKVDRFTGNDVLTIKPASWLTITNNLGADIYTEYRSSVARKGTAGFQNGEFTNAQIFSKNFNNDFLVTIDKNITNDLNLKFIAGHNINEREVKTTTVLAQNLTIDQLYTYSNASTSVPTLGYSKRRSYSVFGDLGLGYKNYAFLNITGRNDWFSTLPVENRSYFYPSVSGSFVYSEFLKSTKWLSYGKLRIGAASVGSDLDPYQLDFQYTPTTTAFIQYISSAATTFPFGTIATAFAGPRTLPNSSLKPQLHTTYEIGTDIKLFNNRVGLSVTYYESVTKNQLISIDVPISTGYFANSVNAGKLKNKGIEIEVNVVPVKTKNFSWSIDMNFAKNKQTVVELTDKLNQYTTASGWSGLLIKAETGGTFGLYGTGWLRDSSGNIVIDATSGLRQTKTNVRFGDIYPEWTAGINNTFSYKGLSLSFLVDIRKGGVFYSGTVSSLRTSGLAIETLGNREKSFIDKGVIFDGTKYVANIVPVQSMQDFWNRYAATTNTEGNVFDASFVKLREVRLAYALPGSLFKNGFIKGIEFGVEGRNLWIIKKFVPHVDPEVNFFGSGSIGEGVEFNSVPSTRSIGFNLKATF